jgi:5-hydroxyisourate hydrolase-like protein (transthyretin family)
MSRRIVSGVPRHVCVLTLLLVCLPALPQAALYRIAGTVVNAATGEPVSRVTVAALSASDHQPVALVVTGDDGRFAVEGLAAAKYELTASRRGFLTALYDDHQGNYNTAIVTESPRRPKPPPTTSGRTISEISRRASIFWR